MNCNYKRYNNDAKFPICEKSEDTTKHVLECKKANKLALSKENSKGEWEELTKTYIKNKNNKNESVIKILN